MVILTVWDVMGVRVTSTGLPAISSGFACASAFVEARRVMFPRTVRRLIEWLMVWAHYTFWSFEKACSISQRLIARRSRLSEKSAIIVVYDSTAGDVHRGCRLGLVARVQPSCRAQFSVCSV